PGYQTVMRLMFYDDLHPEQAVDEIVARLRDAERKTGRGAEREREVLDDALRIAHLLRVDAMGGTVFQITPEMYERAKKVRWPLLGLGAMSLLDDDQPE